MEQSRAVTTQEAADLLGMSRPTLVKLLTAGAMPYQMVGNQRRVYLRDVVEYARKRRVSSLPPWSMFGEHGPLPWVHAEPEPEAGE